MYTSARRKKFNSLQTWTEAGYTFFQFSILLDFLDYN